MSQTLVDISLIKDTQTALVIDSAAQIISDAGFVSGGSQTSAVVGVAGRKVTTTTSSGLIVETASGTDSNIGFQLVTKGTSGVLIKGQTAGTAITAGYVGETLGDKVFGTATTATVTITSANPGVVTWTSHGFSSTVAQPVVFTTTGGLPTNITAGTTYYTVPSSVTTNTFTIATTVANALAGTQVDCTAGAQSGTQTGTAGCKMSNGVVADICGMILTPGDWDVWGNIQWNANAATTWTTLEGSISQTSVTLASPGAVRGTTYNLLAQISAAATNGVTTLNLMPTIINVSANTNIFMPVKGAFATNIIGAYGSLMARRRS